MIVLVLRDVELAGLLVELLVGPGRDAPCCSSLAIRLWLRTNRVCRAVSSTFSLPRTSPVTNRS